MTLVDITEVMYDEVLIIVCETENTERINDQRYHLGDKIIKIDHHPNVDPYGDIEWIDTSVSSTSEMIYTFYLTLKEEGLKMNDDAARLIYAGIVGDTGRFLFPSTSNTTFKYAAELVTYDFNRESLYDGIYQIDENVARLRGYILLYFIMSDIVVMILTITIKKLK